MLFNSLEFALFFGIVFSLYLFLDHKWQNRMLLGASYIFYGAWNWKFLSLIAISTVLDYMCGLKIHTSENRKKKLFLFISVFGNLSILGFFKYFNFFAASLTDLLGYFGLHLDPFMLRIILPVGISFYTFQTMSYTIDIYRRKLKPTRQFLDFALFVAFFPQLVAGPIERASHLLPQILSPRKFRLDYFYEGVYLIFWGLYLKIFIADNMSRIVDPVFAESATYNGPMTLLALYAFTIQIFCDFAGYSNIARGLGRLMGFDIMINFNLPYFATNPREFWRRWHISLSQWLRDYLYIPLGGNKKGTFITYRNLVITMLLGGLWHGAAWTFVLWGAYHGLILIIHRLIEPWLSKIPSPENAWLNKIWFLARVIFFFHVICLGWLIFRAQSLTQLSQMLQCLFTHFDIANFPEYAVALKQLCIYASLLFIIQIFQYKKDDLLVLFRMKPAFQAALYTFMFYCLLLLGAVSSAEFIYFQF
ncbi:MAG: MBOAT family protein [Sedimentisphaerales bacterium]|nr:MBOAT family protein [Sedimentisphaerales bacterium]